ncbi:uncharacterized protein EV420DRAFT_1179767 [Desarmillaria tabescens]|uniref:Secreted protein n=1 Tax=Armillaria tabescens TaxID=1929756 RepID=A0AA39NAW5_ARMTA|nr:uncharacterized protein EV420DRAFT_1179767 [Desarmillaria tabescens]KAK0462246.1 hypothetical protein EV420DRAFT_1179767 [Desarmillaria tabescens]
MRFVVRIIIFIPLSSSLWPEFSSRSLRFPHNHRSERSHESSSQNFSIRLSWWNAVLLRKGSESERSRGHHASRSHRIIEAITPLEWETFRPNSYSPL